MSVSNYTGRLTFGVTLRGGGRCLGKVVRAIGLGQGAARTQGTRKCVLSPGRPSRTRTHFGTKFVNSAY